MAKEPKPMAKRQDDYFKIDNETHIIGDLDAVAHFPGVQQWWRGVFGTDRAMTYNTPEWAKEGMEQWETERRDNVEDIIKLMDKYEVDIGCILPESMMETTGYHQRWCTNWDGLKVVEAHPDRFLLQPNLSPMVWRGIDNTIWELNYWAERGVKIFKSYAPEDTYINDPALWPVYERMEELGVVLNIHTGTTWCPPGKAKYCHPGLLDDVCRDFQGLKICAFHMGAPHFQELNYLARAHTNLYLGVTLMQNLAITQPREYGKMIGEALKSVGEDRILWGSDYSGFGRTMRYAVMSIRDFEMPEDLQEQYGYPEITDEMRRKIFGENLAKILGIDTSKRRINKK